VDSSGSRQEPVAGSCEHGSKPSDFIMAENFLISRVTISFTKAVLHGAEWLVI
jgi:hypothetical protein